MEKEFITYSREVLIADASRYVWNKEWTVDFGKEIIYLTYLDFGKPRGFKMDPETFKKFYGFTSWQGRESVSNAIWKKVEIRTVVKPI